MFDTIFNTISNWAEALIDMIVTILNRIIKWIDDIIDWARKMVQGIITRIIFIITRKKLEELLQGGNIPTKKIPGLYDDDKKFEDGIVQVVHDTETNKIVASRYISGEGIDDDLKMAMRGTDILQLK